MPSKITKRGKVRWLGCVKKNGTRQQALFETKADALAWEANIRKALEREAGETVTEFSLLEWSDEYLDFSKQRHGILTYKEKRDVFRRFFKSVSPDTSVFRLQPKDALSYLQRQASLRSGYAANKDRKNLLTAWSWGMKYHGFPSNPFAAVDKFPEVRTPRYVPQEEDFMKVFDLAQGQDRVMLLAFLHTAGRRSEIFRLRWDEADFKNNRVRLWTSKRRGGDREYDWLPMTSELKEALLWWWETRPDKTSPYVFVSLDKTPFCEEYYGKPFTKRNHFMGKLCEKAGVKPFGFHAIRHLTASGLYRKGYPVATIQAILRHKSPNTTERYLRTLGLEDTREALESISVRSAKIIPFNQKKAPEAVASGAEYFPAVLPSGLARETGP